MGGDAVDPQAVAGHDLVAHQVQNENIGPAAGPSRVGFQFLLGEIPSALHHHRGAAHELLQAQVIHAGADDRGADVRGMAGAGQVAGVETGTYDGTRTVPVGLDHIRQLELLVSGLGIRGRVVEPPFVDHVHRAIDFGVQVRSEINQRRPSRLAFLGRDRREDKPPRRYTRRADLDHEHIGRAVLPADILVKCAPGLDRADFSKKLCRALHEQLDIPLGGDFTGADPRVLTSLRRVSRGRRYR